MRTVSIDAAILEVKRYCSDSDVIEYDPLINFLQSYFDLLAKETHAIFKKEVIAVLDNEFISKIPYPSDLVRIANELDRITRLHGKMIRVKEGNVVTFYPVLKSNKVDRPQTIKKVFGVQIADDKIEQPNTDRGAYIVNTIEDYLLPFKGDVISGNDYNLITRKLKAFFEGEITGANTPFFVKHGNMIKLGYALGSIYRAFNNDPISFEYIDLCKQLFDCYRNIEIDKNRQFNNNLYKYLTIKKQ